MPVVLTGFPIMSRARACLRCAAVFASLCLMLGMPAAQGANCAVPPPAAQPAAPQVTFIRSYNLDFRSPLRLAADTQNALYIADPQKGQVVKRAADGRILRVVEGLGRPGALALDLSGNIYIADLDAGLVTVFDSAWNPLNSFDAGVVQASDIALDAARSRLYLSDSEGHRIRVFTTAGQWLFDIGSQGEGDGQFLYPSGLFFDAARDELLVSDQFSYRVQVLDADGGFKYCLGGSSANPGSFFQRGRTILAPQGLWSDAQGRIYVADSYAGQIKVLDRNARLLASIGSFGQAGGELRIPSDVAMDGAGRLYVANANNARIEMFGIDAFADPEAFSPALLTVRPGVLDAELGGSLDAIVKTPTYRVADIDLASLRLNGVAALTSSLTDVDRDGLAEIVARFDVAALLPTLPAFGPGQLLLSAASPGLPLHAIARVEVASRDADQDGVNDDSDACPATVAGELVDASGCALAQYCPCDAFKSHGKYVKCLNRAVKRFEFAGLLERAERKRLLREAARSDCGKGKRKGKRERDDDDHEHEHEHEREHEHDGKRDDDDSGRNKPREREDRRPHQKDQKREGAR